MSALDGASLSSIMHLFQSVSPGSSRQITGASSAPTSSSAQANNTESLNNTVDSSSPSSSHMVTSFPSPHLARRHILLHLKNCCMKLTSYAHDNSSLDQTVSPALDLCTALEICFFYGIRSTLSNGQPSLNASIPLWGLLERLECSVPPCIPLRNTVGAVASVLSLRSPLAKARGWIRQVLNTKGAIDATLNAMLSLASQSQGSLPSSKHDFLGLYYTNNSILYNKEDAAVMLAIVRSLKVYSFTFSLDDEHLNMPSLYLPSLIQLNAAMNAPNVSATAAVIHHQSNSSNNKPNVTKNEQQRRRLTQGKDGSILEVLLSSVETGLGNVMNNFDTATSAASKLIDAIHTSSQNHGPSEEDSAFENVSSRRLLRSLSMQQRRLPLYGSSLRDLLVSEIWCFHADMDPRLGVPSPILRLMHIIHQNIHTKDLFRVEADENQVRAYRSSFELGHGLMETPPIHIACQLLLDFLHALPEPLLGYDFYDAILACQDVELLGDRVRNISLLINQTAWYNKPLLFKVLNLFHDCCKGENAKHNGLNIVAMAVLTTPIFLRPPGRPPMNGTTNAARERYDAWIMNATASGSGIVSLMISQCQGILVSIAQDLADIQGALTLKCQRLRRLQENCCKGYFVTVLSEDSELTYFKELFELLQPVEAHIKSHNLSPKSFANEFQDIGPGPVSEVLMKATDSDKSIGDIFNDSRWSTCGFPQENPSRDFENNGLIGIQCLIAFIKKYPSNAAEIATRLLSSSAEASNDEAANDRISLGQLATQICKIVIQVLHLLPTPDSSERPLPSLAKHASIWALLNNPRAFQEVFDVAMLTYEDYWNFTSTTTEAFLTRHRSAKFRVDHSIGGDLYKATRGVSLHTSYRNIRSASDSTDPMASTTPDQSPRDRQSSDSHEKDESHANNLMEKYINILVQTQLCLETIMSLEKPETVDQLWSAWKTNRCNRRETLQSSEANELHKNSKESQLLPDKPIDSITAIDESTPSVSCDVHQEEARAAVCDMTSSSESIQDIEKTLIDCLTKVIGGSTILSIEQINQLEKALPSTMQFRNWTNIFRMTRDGSSMSTLINSSSSKSKQSSSASPAFKDNTSTSQYLLIVQDNHQNRFGGLICDASLGRSGDKYYGDGNMAVFTFFDQSHVQLFHASHKNSYYLLSSSEVLAMGGGGNFAIYLDGSLCSGSSGPCSTFDSPSLTHAQSPFTCVECELFLIESIATTAQGSQVSPTSPSTPSTAQELD